MNIHTLHAALRDLSLGGIRFYQSLGSTNDAALEWANSGAPDLALVVADEQTTGRGRMGRKWFTPAGTALAMSLVLRPTAAERTRPSRTTGLLAVSLAGALRIRGLQPQIKWPNDVLLGEQKVAGILVETAWTGENLDALVLGMGVNVLAGSVPPAVELLFPATSLEDALGEPLERLGLLNDILHALVSWRPRIGSSEFLQAWERDLAYHGQQVKVWKSGSDPVHGELLGLEPDGSLNLRDEHGKSVSVHFGEVHLRPLA